MFQKAAHIAALCAALLMLLSGCGEVSSRMAETIADYWPAWAGGEPKDVPPRPDDPRYQQFIEMEKAKAIVPSSQQKTSATKEPVTNPVTNAKE